jgi:DNA-binding CsgD family transcriptional regulator
MAVLAEAGLPAEAARRYAIETLRAAVGFARWCWPLTDPGSGLSTNGIGEVDFWPSLPRLLALEQHGDVTSKPQLIASRRPSVALSTATRGDLRRSRRWRECLEPYGVGDELMTVCRDRHGCWGSVELMRDGDDRPFDEQDQDLLNDLAPLLGQLLRAGVRRDWHSGQGEGLPSAPGTLILNRELQPVGWTESVRGWLPTAAFEIAARLLEPRGLPTTLTNSARVQSSPGGWCVIEGALLEGGEGANVAVTLRAASADEVFDILAKIHNFTPRECELVSLVLGGTATKQVAAALCISPHTVQDHLKAVFTKTGVRSRRDLTALLSGRR